MTETVQQRIARQRAAREARDGTPEERRARQRRLDEARRRVAGATFDEFIGQVAAVLRRDPQSILDHIEEIGNAAARLSRLAK